MAIISASVESNGWVLRLVVSGSLGTFASYTLAPDGTPRVALASSHPGFTVSAGAAVSATASRALIATKPLRKPVNPASPNTKVIDETDLGGGQLAVRLALSEHVYATDTSLTLAVLAGWRTGEGAASGISVTNNSTAVAPVPIFRWARPSYDVVTGQFRVSLFVVSHHPNGYQPVAGVKFTATDGTTVKTVWATALATDNDYGDALRCYTVLIDPTTATALTAGLLRCDAEVYPWLGSMRSTDPAGTKSMTNLRTDGYSAAAQAPYVVGYDPAGTRYSAMWAFIDPVNGTTTASASMVQATMALAKAVSAASRPRDINTARQAGYLANRTLAAANGQASQTRSVDGMVCVLAAGTHDGHGATAVTTGIAEAEIPMRIIGDPEDADPRANCIISLATASRLPNRGIRLRYENLTVGAGTNALAGSTAYVSFDRVTTQGRTGLETATTALGTAVPTSGLFNVSATRSRFWRYGVGITSGNWRCGVFRGNEYSATVQALAFLKNRWIGPGEDTAIGSAARPATTGWVAPTLAGQAEDIIVGYNDLRHARARVWQPSYLPAGTAGTPNQSLRRNVFIGNICERIGNDASPFYGLGEDLSATMSYNIIENNSFIGDRANTLYSDPLPTTAAECETLLNQAFVNRVAGNAFDWWPTKHDDFADPQTLTLRVAASTGTTGYRPHMVEAWSALYGVGAEGNYDTARATQSDFQFEYPGVRSVQNLSGGSVSPLYTNDASILGTNAGGGNYVPSITSPLLGRTVRGNSDVDLFGTLRTGSSFSGALSSPAISVLPEALTFGPTMAQPAVAGVAVATAEAMTLGPTFAAATVTAAARPAPAAMAFGLSFAQAAVSATPAITMSPAGMALGLAFDATAIVAAAGVAPAGMAFGLELDTPAMDAAAAPAPAAMALGLSIGAATVTITLPPDLLQPVSLAEVKAWLVVDHSDDDITIAGLVRAAAVAIEQHTGLALSQQSFVFNYPGFPDGRQALPLWRRPVDLVGSVSYIAAADGAEMAIDGAQFRLREQDNRAWLLPAFGAEWPKAENSKGSVSVSVTAGFADISQVPEPLRLAVLRLVGHWYANREDVAAGGAQELPLGVRMLLAPYRGHVLG